MREMEDETGERRFAGNGNVEERRIAGRGKVEDETGKGVLQDVGRWRTRLGKRVWEVWE